MSTALNRETGDHTKPVEKVVSVPIGNETHTFSVWCSTYTASKLTHEDWIEAGKLLRDHVLSVRRKMILRGLLFAPGAGVYLRHDAERAMRKFIYDRFKAAQARAGNLQYQVDSLLAGSEYRV